MDTGIGGSAEDPKASTQWQSLDLRQAIEAGGEAIHQRQRDLNPTEAESLAEETIHAALPYILGALADLIDTEAQEEVGLMSDRTKRQRAEEKHLPLVHIFTHQVREIARRSAVG